MTVATNRPVGPNAGTGAGGAEKIIPVGLTTLRLKEVKLTSKLNNDPPTCTGTEGATGPPMNAEGAPERMRFNALFWDASKRRMAK
jgi:hypothetical protein